MGPTLIFQMLLVIIIRPRVAVSDIAARVYKRPKLTGHAPYVVCRSACPANCGKTADRIAFGMVGRIFPRKHSIDKIQLLPREGVACGVAVSAIEWAVFEPASGVGRRN